MIKKEKKKRKKMENIKNYVEIYLIRTNRKLELRIFKKIIYYLKLMNDDYEKNFFFEIKI
jgi:hypothetical protein